MTSAGSNPSPGGSEAEPIDPDIYNAFIGQIELNSIWLSSSLIENPGGPGSPDEVSIDIAGNARWESVEDGLVAFHAYDVTFKESDSKVADISVTFGLEFKSEQAMTEELFAVFQEVNLPVNTWPYLRSFLADALGRMGWPPLTLPAFKTGTQSPF